MNFAKKLRVSLGVLVPLWHFLLLKQILFNLR